MFDQVLTFVYSFFSKNTLLKAIPAFKNFYLLTFIFSEYFYIVNKQITHIVYAHLLLTVMACGYFFLKNLPDQLVTAENKSLTVDDEVTVPLSAQAKAGKDLFQSKCASCHNLKIRLTAPPLQGFEARGPWSDRQKLYDWIKNPASFMEKDRYTASLKNEYGILMTAFPSLKNEEIDNIVAYVNEKAPLER